MPCPYGQLLSPWPDLSIVTRMRPSHDGTRPTGCLLLSQLLPKIVPRLSPGRVRLTLTAMKSSCGATGQQGIAHILLTKFLGESCIRLYPHVSNMYPKITRCYRVVDPTGSDRIQLDPNCIRSQRYFRCSHRKTYTYNPISPPRHP